MNKVILRADGNSLIGFGHIYRLLALADILKGNFYFIFVLFKSSDFIEKEIRKYCDEYIVLPGKLPHQTADEIGITEEIKFDLDDLLTGDEIVVLDGYYFGKEYQKSVRKKKCRLVCIDDLAVNYFYADAIINHAPGIEPQKYKTEPYTKLYTGLDYAILRKPFLEPNNAHAIKNNDVLISLGGSDYFKITCKLVNFLIEFNEFHTLNVMCSSSFPEEMMNELVELSKKNQRVKIYQNLDALEIVGLMDVCKYAFVSASTVLLEAYARGLICFTGHYTNNQLFIYDGFVKENKALGLGDLRNISLENIQKILVGDLTLLNLQFEKENAKKNILAIFGDLKFQLRKATEQDAKLFFYWANDEEVRNNAIKTKKVMWAEHEEWFSNKLSSPKSKLFVFEYMGEPIGQIRIDLNEDGFWIIDYSIDKTRRGQGFGKKIIQALINSECSVKKFLAFVKSTNIKSGKIFESCGFRFTKSQIIEKENYFFFELLA